MIEPVVAKFQWGQRVEASFDLFNDGSFPECAADALLARAGDIGEVVQVGTHTESSLPVYLVEFTPDRVVGCLEHELAAL
jgi:nitrogen fixation protein NifZ